MRHSIFSKRIVLCQELNFTGGTNFLSIMMGSFSDPVSTELSLMSREKRLRG